MPRLVLLLLPTLLACTPLVGEWEGPLRCGDVNEEVAFELEWNGEEYEGEGVVSYEGQAGGNDVGIEVEFAVVVDAAPDEDGVLDVDAESERCSYAEGEQEYDFPCVLDVDDGNTFTWDRADAIDVRGNCEGRISRS